MRPQPVAQQQEGQLTQNEDEVASENDRPSCLRRNGAEADGEAGVVLGGDDSTGLRARVFEDIADHLADDILNRLHLLGLGHQVQQRRNIGDETPERLRPRYDSEWDEAACLFMRLDRRRVIDPEMLGKPEPPRIAGGARVLDVISTPRARASIAHAASAARTHGCIWHHDSWKRTVVFECPGSIAQSMRVMKPLAIRMVASLGIPITCDELIKGAYAGREASWAGRRHRAATFWPAGRNRTAGGGNRRGSVMASNPRTSNACEALATPSRRLQPTEESPANRIWSVSGSNR
jgi:hypothetical protein